jgi:hypothetical protein
MASKIRVVSLDKADRNYRTLNISSLQISHIRVFLKSKQTRFILKYRRTLCIVRVQCVFLIVIDYFQIWV